jgi:hypothetical protein
MEVSGQLHASAALPQGKSHRVHIRQEAGWAPEPFWSGGKEKNSQPPPGIDRPARSPALYRLNYHGSNQLHLVYSILFGGYDIYFKKAGLSVKKLSFVISISPRIKYSTVFSVLLKSKCRFRSSN